MAKQKHSSLPPVGHDSPARRAESAAGSYFASKSQILACVLIVVAALVGYHGSFTGAFVFDDVPSITENTTIRHLWPLSGPLTPPHGGGWTVEGRPLINLSLALNYAVGGLNVWGYHAFNLAVHILAALVLYGIVRRTLLTERLRARFGNAAAGLALAVALIWVVHPLQTEAVTYIVQRAESLMGLFYLLTLYCFMRGVVPGATKLWGVGAVAACALGMASKEVMISAPIMVLLHDRVFVAGSFREALRRRWPVYLGLAATWMLLGYLVITTGLIGHQSGEGEAAIWWRYALTELSVMVHYVRLALWPDRLCLDYGFPVARAWGAILPGIILGVALLTTTVWAWVRKPELGFVGAWFFLILAPTSSVLPLKDLVFEHRMYLPLAAVVTAVVVGVWQLVLDRFAWVGVGGCAVAVAGLAAVTVGRNLDYRSVLTMWTDTVRKAPGNPRVHHNIGVALQDNGKTQEAIWHYEQAVRINPNYMDAHNNLGNVLMQLGRLSEAMKHLEKAVQLNPKCAEAHNNLGMALVRIGKPQEAITHIQRSLQLKPDKAEAHNNLGMALLQAGRPKEGIAHITAALKLKPDYPEAHNNWASALLQFRDSRGAIGHIKEALRLKPDYAEAYYNLGLAFEQTGQMQDAIAQYRQALQFKPDFAQAHNSWGTALLNADRIPEAIEHYRQALQLAPGYAEAHHNLAVALGRAGKTQEAISHYEQALKIKPDYVEAREHLNWLLAQQPR